STPLVISSADSGEQPTWTVTPTPRRPTALAMTLLAQRDLTQTRPVGSPTSIYTITHTPSITPTWYEKVFPTVTLRKWPTYTFTPRPTSTRLPTLNMQQTEEKLHSIETATGVINNQLTATAIADNFILVANVPDLSHTVVPTVVFSASGAIKLAVNANWLPGGKGLIFEGSVSDHRKLYTLQLPGGAPTLVAGQNSQLLNENPPVNNKDNIQPAISPNGDWIAFSSFPVDDRIHHHLFIMSSDGKVLYQVTQGIYNEEFQPSWSPDGKKIIFISVEYGYYSQIFTLDVSWLDDRETSHTPEDIPATPLVAMTSVNIETPPHYCMDTDKPWIVFSAKDSYYGARQIYVMKTDGSNVIRVTKDYGNSYPDWSSDCNTLIFVQDQGGVSPAIYIYTLDMTWLFADPLVVPNKIVPDLLINNTSGLVSSPHFSPDGSQVVFVHTYLFVPTSTSP
ncbi:MAG: hypothetical protein ABSE06_09950, partial [Anaerolineaceae bacterium]